VFVRFATGGMHTGSRSCFSITAKNFSKDDLCGVSHQETRMLGSGKPCAYKKDRVRDTVDDRSANRDDQGFPKVYRENAENSHRRPSYNITEADENEPHDHSGGALYPHGLDVSRILQRLPDIFCFGKACGNFLKHRDWLFFLKYGISTGSHGDSETLSLAPARSKIPCANRRRDGL